MNLDATTSEFLDFKNAPRLYGGSMSWWRKAVSKRLIPHFKRGASVVFSRADLDAYFAARRVAAKA